MAKVIVTKRLEEEINKKFKGESLNILKLMYSLRENPYKGKTVGQVGGIIIKELRYEAYRFYFITDGYKIKILDKEEIKDLIIKFVRVSNKKTQQKIIDEIKEVLRKLGQEGFESWKFS
ncbi:hypothetical protein HY212_03300 [Candidatus Pacearchaeota archaeon]|nr:hypothetical protein [Candidatus Pacearchaeota archaeon]